jgi:redox-sensitive bicupin YhaK (pirin superfamily)
MKAGNGIIHDENFNFDSQTDSKFVHGFQFWINLPAKNKAESPEHIAIQAEEIPFKKLTNNSGWIKVIVGKHEDFNSKIPNYSEQFLYHLHIENGKQFTINIAEEIEAAIFLPTKNAVLNDEEFQAGDFVAFETKSGEIEIKNNSKKAIDVLLFGGEKYSEPIVAEGPFVMNSSEEIVQAYRDFYAGKYGEIKTL